MMGIFAKGSSQRILRKYDGLLHCREWLSGGVWDVLSRQTGDATDEKGFIDSPNGKTT